ncbi:ATP-binding protein [Streptomyces sp. NBC_01497]|uniref:ATP-binding protein n=1 Tax=Streptomyces sp. NBC_01497 TaxID=2903885 RepID=UPI002E38069D|nr:ATP-binding protein [Streptomyces sp. NBC_01497]
MSQLRAPATRPDRREGGRHGRPGARGRTAGVRPAPRQGQDTRIRPQLLRAAVLPAIVASLSGAAAVVVVLRSAGTDPTAGAWAALAGTALVALGSVAVAALGAERTARSVIERCHALRRTSARGQEELRSVLEQLRRGDRVTVRRTPPDPHTSGDEIDRLARELTRSQEAAVGAVVQASQLSSSAGDEQRVEVFVNLARRLQSLVHREIQLLDELENEVEDPELLKGLFHVDHLATRIRRHAENLAVLGGAVSRRQWSRPVTVTEVLRSAVAEVEQYPRVTLVPPVEGTLRGHAVADVIHLLAELVENATLFSAPHTQVLLRAQRVTAGLALEVEDRGLGMPPEEQKHMNGLLADPDQVDVAHLLQDGRIGLFVVSALARRHGIAVRLQSNIYGGVQAVLVLPEALLGVEDDALPPDALPPDARPPLTALPAPPIAPPSASAPLPAQISPPGAVPASNSQGGPTAPASPAPSGAAVPARADSDRHATPVRRTPTSPVPPAAGRRASRRAQPGRPELPKRQEQEYLAPQLRERPAAPPAEGPGEPAVHDPGLMAAFRRGIGLAETEAGAKAAADAGTAPAAAARPPEEPRPRGAAPKPDLPQRQPSERPAPRPREAHRHTPTTEE